jgi:protein-S-isoprenylcysteine O-methyltransferase Ste14
MGIWAVRLRNIPVPEANLAAIAVAAALEQVRQWRLPGPRSVRRSAGWSIVVAGSFVVVQSLKTVGSTDLARPERLVTSGPYALSRNPMYVGWALVQLGIGVAAGSGWMLATLPVAGAWIHRDVLREERRLGEKFGDEYQEYCATVGRYLPKR